MSCKPEKYDEWDGTFFDSFEDSEVYKSLNTDVVKLLISIATLAVAVLSFISRKK